MELHNHLLNIGRAAGLPLPAYISVMGGFRSGTNYLRYLLEENYHVRVNYDAYGWKHVGLPIRERKRRTVPFRPAVASIAKNPFAYLSSLHKYYNDRGKNIVAESDWDAFLTSPFVIFNRNDRRSPQYHFGNPVQYWNFINWNLAFTPEVTMRAIMVTYDAVLLDPQREVGRVAEALKLRPKAGDFRTPQGYMRRLGDKSYKAEDMVVENQTSPKVSFIAEKQYLEPYSETQRRFIARQADARLRERLGFTGEEYSL